MNHGKTWLNACLWHNIESQVRIPMFNIKSKLCLSRAHKQKCNIKNMVYTSNEGFCSVLLKPKSCDCIRLQCFWLKRALLIIPVASIYRSTHLEIQPPSPPLRLEPGFVIHLSKHFPLTVWRHTEHVSIHITMNIFCQLSLHIQHRHATRSREFNECVKWKCR